MAPKTSSTHNASTILNDAVNSFSKNVHQAFAAIEEKAKADIARATAEAQEARRERDEAVQALHDGELKAKDWQRRAESWNASVEKSELTIQHQAETISQLREEAQQWKNQLLRFEESSHREVQDWKDQYQRAEQERVKLAARVDELISEQLKLNTQANQSMLYTPRSTNAPPSLPSKYASTSTRTAPSKSKSTPKSKSTTMTATTGTDREDTFVDSARPISPKSQVATSTTTRTPRQRAAAREIAAAGPAHKAAMSRPGTSASQRRERDANGDGEGASGSGSQQPRQTLIRRVNAIIEVPVKEEPLSEDDDLNSGSQSAESEYEPESERRRKAPQRPKQSSRRSSIKSRPIIDSEDEDDDEDDDDQLLIGAEENHNEVYGVHPVSRAPPADTPKRSRVSLGNTSTSKKRKLDSDMISTGRASKATRSRRDE